MALMDGKVAVIMGVANKRSIAWGITKALSDAGAKIVLSYQNDRMGASVKKLVTDLPEAPYMDVCDVTKEDEIEAFFAGVKKEFGGIDALVHSLAFAKHEELGGDFKDTTWEGYQLAQQISAYSLISVSRAAADLMADRDSAIACLTYYGAEKVVKGYNVMGVAKASLESNTRYLAESLGPKGIRINAISAGPIKTVSAMGVAGFGDILGSIEEKAPLRRNVSQDEIGKAALFLLSDMASGVTGQVLYVDAGISIMGV